MGFLYIEAFGDAIITTLQNAITNTSLSITGLSTGDVGWARAILTEPMYIVNPNTLPVIKVRFNNYSASPGPSKRMECEYEFSIFYFRKQTVGQQHQELLIQDLEKIAEVFTNNNDSWRPTELASIDTDNQQLLTAFVSSIIMYPELHYDIDDPSIRISTGEIKLNILSYSYAVG